jgi:hypothetical protein
MKIPCTDLPLDLSRRRIVRIEDPAHVQLQARLGTLWITIDGEARDIVVEAGESFEFTSRAPAMVGALHGDAAATAHRRCGAASPRRRSAWPLGLLRRAAAV